MFIQTETTPNPNTMKFFPGSTVLAGGTADFRDEKSAETSPLASALFAIADVRGVFFADDFITVTKRDNVPWDVVKPSVLTTIMEHFVAGKPVMADGKAKTAARTTSENDDDIVKTIKELLDTRVRPAVAQDGGDIIYRDFKEGILYLEMHGSCSGCPSSTATLKQGIENMMKHYVPEVLQVEAVAE